MHLLGAGGERVLRPLALVGADVEHHVERGAELVEDTRLAVGADVEQHGAGALEAADHGAGALHGDAAEAGAAAPADAFENADDGVGLAARIQLGHRRR